MASVSSLDKDMRNIRLSKYTPQAANEVRIWIQDVLGERLADGDLLEALKDGIALCKYAIRYYHTSDRTETDTSPAGLSTSQPHQVYASKTHPCPSSRWRTSLTFSAPANRLL